MEPQVIHEAVRSGLARYEYRHFIIFGANSEYAALATECAGDQGAWWEFHDEYLFEAQARTFTRAGTIALAEREGLDLEQFQHCLDTQAHAQRLITMQEQAIASGVRGTPTITVNGRIVGSSLQSILDAVAEASDRSKE